MPTVINKQKPTFNFESDKMTAIDTSSSIINTKTNNGVTKQKKKIDESNYEKNNLVRMNVRNARAKDVKLITYGVPDDSFLINSAFGINVNHGDTKSLFRMLKIYDVGSVKLGSVASSLSYSFVSKKSEFNTLISNVADYNLGVWDSIRFALMSDSYDVSFSNSYGGSFLETINNISSSMIGEGRQLGFLPDLSRMASKAAGFMQNMLGRLPFVGDSIKNWSFLNNLVNETGTISHVLHGDRAILPKVWKGSGMGSTFSCRVILSALTEDADDLEHRILVPLMILSVLSTPIGAGAYWFNYPFLVKCEIEGVRKIEAGYISDLRVSFGSNSSFFSTDKKYITLEINFTITDMFSVMVTPASSGYENTIVPTTKKWFKYISNYIKK